MLSGFSSRLDAPFRPNAWSTVSDFSKLHAGPLALPVGPGCDSRTVAPRPNPAVTATNVMVSLRRKLIVSDELEDTCLYGSPTVIVQESAQSVRIPNWSGTLRSTP